MAICTLSKKPMRIAGYDYCTFAVCIICSLIVGHRLSSDYTVSLCIRDILIGVVTGLCARTLPEPSYRYYCWPWLAIIIAVVAVVLTVWLRTPFVVALKIFLGALLGAVLVMVGTCVYILAIALWLCFSTAGDFLLSLASRRNRYTVA